MLVLTRRPNETIRINGRVRVTVLGFKGRGKVRIGIEASPDIEIDREEVWERKQEQPGHNAARVPASGAHDPPAGRGHKKRAPAGRRPLRGR